MKGKLAAIGSVLGVLAISMFIGAKLLAEGGSTYVGSKKCKKCHSKPHFKEWEERGHGKAFAALKAEDMAREDDATKKKCVSCHTTGYGKESGFTSAEATPDLVNVGCESCHGPGSEHAAMDKDALKKLKEEKGDMKIQMADPGSCVGCHNPHVNYKAKYGAK